MLMTLYLICRTFLTNLFQEFVTCENWMHLDIAGVMQNSSDVKYLPPGMAGRPTRTLVEFLKMLSQE